ncbi:cytochrome c/FTR1 family iron permease [Sinimarinibacterium thermocellulolyticum]|uniref:FTR1 family protein n=1 Tax=Sinimarinibacterium thermocellulolyticum TaxID=3170016 RepID=A0ABV2AC06_9GAMM
MSPRSIPVCLRRFCAAILLAAAATPGGVAAADPTEVATLWRLLDYIAVDYREAVDGQGRIVNADEYAEMREFAQTVGQRLQTLPDGPQQASLRAEADALIASIEARAAPERIAAQARSLAAALMSAYPLPQAPLVPPDVARGAVLYQQLCAACHGEGGAGDGPLAAGMEPPPIDFTDAQRADERSLFALYQVIGQGLEDTPMPAYAHLPEADRWALAFYVGSLAYLGEKDGAEIWQSAAARAAVPDLEALATLTPSALAQTLGHEPARRLTAYLRREPAAVLAGGEQGLELTRRRLAESRAAYAGGDANAAARLALSAYLDGFEPVEALLSARDADLVVQIETAMSELRARIARRAPAAEIDAQIAALEDLFDTAQTALGEGRADAISAFVGALTILLREGFEALLLVVAIVAFLRKAGRSEALTFVHAGWVGALAAGAATWAAATWLVTISGAGRELTEGAAALFAAAVLLFVGIWMHGKSQAGAWQRYVQAKLAHALSKRSAWFLALLSFVVVYREVFETILFYAALWSQGQREAIVAGAATAVLVLAAIAWAMLRYARRIPIAQFFALSAALVAVLAVVLAGKGVAALQEGGFMAVTTLAGPRIAWIGVYPTVQGLAAQAAVLAALVAGFAFNRLRARAVAA